MNSRPISLGASALASWGHPTSRLVPPTALPLHLPHRSDHVSPSPSNTLCHRLQGKVQALWSATGERFSLHPSCAVTTAHFSPCPSPAYLFHPHRRLLRLFPYLEWQPTPPPGKCHLTFTAQPNVTPSLLAPQLNLVPCFQPQLHSITVC